MLSFQVLLPQIHPWYDMCGCGMHSYHINGPRLPPLDYTIVHIFSWLVRTNLHMIDVTCWLVPSNNNSFTSAPWTNSKDRRRMLVKVRSWWGTGGSSMGLLKFLGMDLVGLDTFQCCTSRVCLDGWPNHWPSQWGCNLGMVGCVSYWARLGVVKQGLELGYTKYAYEILSFWAWLGGTCGRRKGWSPRCSVWALGIPLRPSLNRSSLLGCLIEALCPLVERIFFRPFSFWNSMCHMPMRLTQWEKFLFRPFCTWTVDCARTLQCFRRMDGSLNFESLHQSWDTFDGDNSMWCFSSLQAPT